MKSSAALVALSLCLAATVCLAHGRSSAAAAQGPREIPLTCVATGEVLRLAPTEHYEIRPEGVCMGVPINRFMAAIDRGEIPLLAPHTWWGLVNNCYVKFNNPDVDACFSCIISDDGNMRCDSDLFGLKNNDRGWFTRQLDTIFDAKKAEMQNLELRDLMACPDPNHKYFKFGFTDKGKYKTDAERVVFKLDSSRAFITPTTMIDPKTNLTVPLDNHERISLLSAAWDELDRYGANVEQRGKHSHRNKVILRDILVQMPRAITTTLLHHLTAGVGNAAANAVLETIWQLRNLVVDKVINALAQQGVNTIGDATLDALVSKVEATLKQQQAQSDIEKRKRKCFNGFWSEKFIHSPDAKADPERANSDAQAIDAIMQDPGLLQRITDKVKSIFAKLGDPATTPAPANKNTPTKNPTQGQLAPATGPLASQP